MIPILWRASGRFLPRHPWQLGLAILGVALGVAVVVSIDIARGSAERSFDQSYQSVTGQATHQIIGGPAGLDEKLYTELRTRVGIYPAAPVVHDYITLPSHPGQALQFLGIDPFAEVGFRTEWQTTGPAQDRASRDDILRRLVTEPGAVLMSERTGKRLGLGPEQEFTVQIGPRQQTLRLLDFIAPKNDGSKQSLDDLLISDIGTAQELLGMRGRLSRIDLKLANSTEDTALLERLRRNLPPGVELTPAEARAEASKKMTQAFHTNLLALSLLALLVGAFLIYNTMSFVVLQRRPLIGALRAAGVTQAQVFRLVLSEALAVGAAGTALGLALGVLLGHGLVSAVTHTINAFYFLVTVRELALTPLTYAKGIGLGLGATVIAALTPAWEAASVTPRLALTRSHLESRMRRLIHSAVFGGITLILLGGAVLLLSEKTLALAFLGEFLFILGCALLTPATAMAIVAGLKPIAARVSGVTARMALRAVQVNLSRTAVAIAALMLATATTIGMGLLIGSFRQTVADWLHTLLRADMYIAAPESPSRAPGAQLDAALAGRIAATPGVEAISTVRRFRLQMANGLIQVAAYQMAPASYQGFRFQAGDPASVWPAFDHGEAVIVSEPFAYHHGLGVSDVLPLRTDKGLHNFTIAGIYYDYSSDQGVVAMGRATYERYWRASGLSSIGVYAEPKAGLEELRNRLLERIGPELSVVITLTRELREESMRLFDRTFAITEVLRLLAASIAFAGVLNALMALQLERTRELGLLRACGVTPGQLGRLLIAETGLLGGIAGLLAVPVGIAVAWLLVKIIYQRSFGYAMPLLIDPRILLDGFVLALAAALLAGVYPAIKMARTSPAEALRTE
jgi:putative ABC transport system permease protein